MELKSEDIGTSINVRVFAFLDTCYQYDCNIRIYANQEYYFNHNSTKDEECFCSEHCLRKFEKEIKQ